MSVTNKSSKVAAKTKVKKQLSPGKKTHAIVSDEVGNYEQHPYFIKKANAAKAILRKVGLPESFKVKAV
jgi:hypothetical protein